MVISLVRSVAILEAIAELQQRVIEKDLVFRGKTTVIELTPTPLCEVLRVEVATWFVVLVVSVSSEQLQVFVDGGDKF